MPKADFDREYEKMKENPDSSGSFAVRNDFTKCNMNMGDIAFRIKRKPSRNQICERIVIGFVKKRSKSQVINCSSPLDDDDDQDPDPMPPLTKMDKLINDVLSNLEHKFSG